MWATAVKAPPDFRSQVEQQRTYLLRFATLQLRNPESAEDAVQETLLAALSGEAKFAGRSNLRTWLTGILKHKIVDSIRSSSRELPAGSFNEDAGIEEFGYRFKDNDHWKESPAAWDNPDRALDQKQFMAALEKCLKGLPARTAQAFMMREHMGMDTEELCKGLEITSTHCWVLLYRARMALRQCLETNWFAATRAGGE